MSGIGSASHPFALPRSVASLESKGEPTSVTFTLQLGGTDPIPASALEWACDPDLAPQGSLHPENGDSFRDSRVVPSVPLRSNPGAFIENVG